MDDQARIFGLGSAPPDQEIAAMLSAVSSLADEPALASLLGHMTRDALRVLYPMDTPHPHLIRFSSGLSAHADLRDSFAAAAAMGVLQEEEDFNAFMSLAQRGDLIVDVGANIGLYTLHAAKLVGPTGRVVAYEVAADALSLLDRNVVENELSDLVTVRPFAVGAANGKACFQVASEVSFSGLVDTQRSEISKTIEVDVISIDSDPVIAGRPINLLKIDVEGAEADVLLGAVQTLARSPNVIIQFEFSSKNLDDKRHEELSSIVATLLDSDFQLFARRRESVTQLKIVPLLHENFSGNLFLARSNSADRLLAALHRTQPSKRNSSLAKALMRRLQAQTNALQRVHIDDAKLREAVAEFVDAPAELTRLDLIRSLQKLALSGRASEARFAALQSREKSQVSQIQALEDKITALETQNTRLEAEAAAMRAELDLAAMKAVRKIYRLVDRFKSRP